MIRNQVASGSIAVIHIAHAAYGVEPFEAFMTSYRSRPAGVRHHLIIVLKGFTKPALIAPYIDLLDGLDAETIEQPDGGYDIGSYFDVIRTTRHDVYCCLNSRSRIVADDWLAKLRGALDFELVGLAGATGSMESLFSDHLAEKYREATRRPAGIRARFQRSAFNDLRHWLRYPPFPNPHLRTNAFILRRETALAIDPGRIRRRTQTAAFENGRNNATRRLMKMGLRSVVVGRDGRCFDAKEWPYSGTFWQSDQGNLLVMDNQTDLYDQANPDNRAMLRQRAWGPSPPLRMPRRLSANQQSQRK